MFNLLPSRTILKTFASINVLFFLVLVYFINYGNLSLGVIKYISLTIGVLDVVSFLVSIYFWRFIWKFVPLLAEIYFPDINGIWQGKIIFHHELQENELDVKAKIKQNLWSINMDLCTTTSKSYTLVAYPTMEAGNKKLYYIYRNIPKNPEYPEYNGTANLDIRLQANPMKLSGAYYTSRKTNGRIDLKQISKNPNEDYEI